MAELPQEVIVDILSWLPVKSLLRFRCVCKAWIILISNPRFIKLQIDRANENHHHHPSFILKVHGPFLYNFHSIDHAESGKASKLNLSVHISSLTKIVGSCNGLICLIDGEYVFNIVLWNPITRECKYLPYAPLGSSVNGHSRFPVLGFGYSPTTEEYKVLKIGYFYHSQNFDSFQSEVQVYTLGTDSWRRIQDITCDICDRSPGTLVNGAIHWTAICSSGSVIIISFDVGNEEFREVPLPYFVGEELDMPSDINLGVSGGCLCLIWHSYCRDVEIWAMKDYGVGESWTKQFTIRESIIVKRFAYFKTLGFLRNGEILLVRNDRKLVLYDPENGRSRNVAIHSIQNRFQAVTYVASFISPRVIMEMRSNNKH